MGLLSAGGETLGATAEPGVRGLLPSRPVPVRCTSWSVLKCAASASVSRSSQPRRLNSPASKAAYCGLAPAGSPPSPTPAPPILDCPSPHPSASPLSFCQRGSPDSLPFLGVRGTGAPKERPPRGAPRGAPGEGRHCCLHNFLLVSGTPDSARSATRRLQTQAAVGGAAIAQPGRD